MRRDRFRGLSGMELLNAGTVFFFFTLVSGLRQIGFPFLVFEEFWVRLDPLMPEFVARCWLGVWWRLGEFLVERR